MSLKVSEFLAGLAYQFTVAKNIASLCETFAQQVKTGEFATISIDSGSEEAAQELEAWAESHGIWVTKTDNPSVNLYQI
jgi:hypothetical protein